MSLGIFCCCCWFWVCSVLCVLCAFITLKIHTKFHIKNDVSRIFHPYYILALEIVPFLCTNIHSYLFRPQIWSQPPHEKELFSFKKIAFLCHWLHYQISRTVSSSSSSVVVFLWWRNSCEIVHRLKEVLWKNRIFSLHWCYGIFAKKQVHETFHVFLASYEVKRAIRCNMPLPACNIRNSS